MSLNSRLGSFTSFTSKGKKDTSSMPEVRLVLLGKTGSGKSSTGNSILGAKVFEPRVSSSSATRRCRRACGEFRGRPLTLLDTPGLLDTHQPHPEVQQELRRSVAMLFPGPHAFLLAVPVGRFTKSEMEAVLRIQETFGPRVLDFAVVVFTHGDSLEEEGGAAARERLIDGSEELARLVGRCGGRYCVFNNRAARSKGQVTELLGLVDGVLEAHEGGCFTNVMLVEAEEEMEREREEAAKALKEDEERRKQEQEVLVRQWYQGQLKKVEQRNMKEMEEMRRSQWLDRERTETFVREKEKALRATREENSRKEEERRIQEVMQMMALRVEEEKKREALRGKLENLAKTLEEQTEREQKVKRDMEVMLRKEKEENERREEQQLEKEQAIRHSEEMKREALLKEQHKLTEELKEQRRKEEERVKQIETQIHMEKERSEVERQREIENLNAEKRRNNALQRQLWLVTMKLEEHKAEKNGDGGRSNNGKSIHSDQSCPETGNKTVVKKPIESHNSLSTLVRPVSGYVHEMGLVVINAGLEHLGSPCCIQ